MNMAAIIDDVRTRLEANGPECRMDQVVDLCPDLTWNQVFLAVDYLSRTSHVRLVMDRARYWVKIIPPTHCTSDAVSTAALT
jgi:hypothetical protein